MHDSHIPGPEGVDDSSPVIDAETLARTVAETDAEIEVRYLADTARRQLTR